MDQLLNELTQLADVETGRAFRDMTTLRIGGKVSYVVYPKSIFHMDALMDLLKRKNVPVKLLGKGSDLLCSDEDYNGVVIKLDRYFNNTIFTDDNMIIVQAGASIISLSVDAMKRGLSGLEFASGIPGTIGGAIFMNAGAYKSSVSDIVKEVFVYKGDRMEWMCSEDCGFGYRSSVFQDHPEWIIVAAKLQMTPKNSEEIRALMDNRRIRRMDTQPLDKPSCGSVFRNPVDHNAWQLIEGIGYRGRKVGGAMVSDKHCNFIVNCGNAKASDYLALVKEIQDKVKEKYGIEMVTEMERFNFNES